MKERFPLRAGMHGLKTRMLQGFMAFMPMISEVVEEDQWFGHKTELAVKSLTNREYTEVSEQLFNEFKSISDMIRAAFSQSISHPKYIVNYYPMVHPELGRVPSGGVNLRPSHFGGAKDKGDRLYQVGLVERQNSPGQYYKQFPELFKSGFFRSYDKKYGDLTTLRKFPVMEGYKWEKSGRKTVRARAQSSWLVDNQYPYCAMRFPVRRLKNAGYNNGNFAKILVENPETGKAIVCVLSDLGPSKKYADIDLSNYAYDYLEISNRTRLTAKYADDDAIVGAVEVIK